jgi:hypothetical protein
LTLQFIYTINTPSGFHRYQTRPEDDPAKNPGQLELIWKNKNKNWNFNILYEKIKKQFMWIYIINNEVYKIISKGFVSHFKKILY